MEDSSIVIPVEEPSVASQNPLFQFPSVNVPPSQGSEEEAVGDPKDWSEQEEYLLALFADRALCYKLLNEKASRAFARKNMWFAIPVIILSTLVGSANLGVQSYVPSSSQSTASAIIGIISLFSGVLTTLQTFFAFSTKSESHRNASSGWGKLNRLVFSQLSLERAKRLPVKDFLRQSKSEYDRLMEQSPVVPSPILRQFVEDIRRYNSIMLPEECGNLIHSASWEHARKQRVAFLESKEDPDESTSRLRAFGGSPYGSWDG